jgi:integrase
MRSVLIPPDGAMRVHTRDFLITSDLVDHSPMEWMEEPPKPKKRTRVLLDAELGTDLKTALTGDDCFSRIAALLSLTGQRRGEIGGLQWASIWFSWRRSIWHPQGGNHDRNFKGAVAGSMSRDARPGPHLSSGINPQ